MAGSSYYGDGTSQDPSSYTLSLPPSPSGLRRSASPGLGSGSGGTGTVAGARCVALLSRCLRSVDALHCCLNQLKSWRCQVVVLPAPRISEVFAVLLLACRRESMSRSPSGSPLAAKDYAHAQVGPFVSLAKRCIVPVEGVGCSSSDVHKLKS